MLPYTQEFLKDQEGDYNFSKDYYNYSLKGVVIHMGTSDSGHYYSLIQDTSKKTPEWLEFNDTLIKKFDINDLAFEAFGGEDKSMMEYSHTFREKCHNAYLLFYQRNQMYDDNGNEIDLLLNGDVIENQGSESFEFIKADNLKFHVNKILLDQGLDMFFYQIGNDFLRMKEFTSNSLELSKMIIYNLLIVGLRSKERDHLPKNLKLAKELLAKSYELSSWLIFQVSFVEIIKEFLVECAVDDMKYLFSGVIRVAFAAISEKDDSLTYADFKQNSILPTFICVCVFVISEIKFSLNHLFRSLYFLVKVSKNSREFLNELKFFRIFKEFILEEPFSKLVTLPQLNDYSILCELKPIMLNIHINPRKRTSSNLNKITFERQIKDFNYLALILSLLVVNNEIEKEEMKIYFNQIDCLKKIMKLSRKKIVFDQVAQMICFFARDDQTYSVMLFETLFGELNRCDENEMKIYWIVCEELLKIQDSYTIDRVFPF